MPKKSMTRSANKGAFTEKNERYRTIGKLVPLLLLLIMPEASFAQGFDALIEKGQSQLSGVERESDKGKTHVAPETPVAENEEFPLSGPHWPQPTLKPS